MKNFIKLIIGNIIRFCYFFYSNKTSNKIRFKYNQFYSLWVSNSFKKVGQNFFVEFPMYVLGGNNITIGNNFICGQRLRIDTFDEFLGEKFIPKIVIGNFVSIQKDCHIGAINQVIIGNNVLIASKVYIADHSHGKIESDDLEIPPAQRKLYCKGSVIIEDNVWLGEGVVVLPGVTIGKNAIIGANAVVTKSIPKNAVAAGNPARVIRLIGN